MDRSHGHDHDRNRNRNHYHETVLENGLRVLGEVRPQVKSVSVGFFVKTGSRDEPPPQNGVSHFLEHMVFKGTAKRSGLEIDQAFDRLGAEYNAFTGYEYTVYFARVLPEHLEPLVELLADMMRPALRGEDFEVERRVILEEIALYEDRPAAVVRREGLKAFYGDHPLGQEVLGTKETVAALRRDQMAEYLRARYAPGNMALAAVGAFSPSHLRELARRWCAAWEPHEAGRRYPAFTPEPRRRVLHRPQAARQHMVLLAPAPAYQDPRREAAELLADVLGHPGNSRLHWALVDKGLVDQASAAYQAQDGCGLWTVAISCDPERGEEVLEAARREIARLVREGPLPQELDGARNRVLTALAVEGEQSLRRLLAFGFDALYGLPYRSLEESLRAYERVSLKDVKALVDAFPFEPQTLAALGPREDLLDA